MLRGIWVRCVLVLATALLALPTTILALLVPRWSNAIMRAGRVWARLLLAAAGVRVKFHGLQHAGHNTPCIFIANHQSMVDIWVMLSFVPPETRFVAKQELLLPSYGAGDEWYPPRSVRPILIPVEERFLGLGTFGPWSWFSPKTTN